jgi:hypothetical protein
MRLFLLRQLKNGVAPKQPRTRQILLAPLLLIGISPLASTPLSAAEGGTIPDFYRNNTAWSTPRGKNLDPPPPDTPGAHGPIGDHPDYPHMGNISGMPTPRIGDDTNPLLLPWASERMRQTREEIVSGIAPFDPAARCWLPGVPGILSYGVAPMYFLQTPEAVTIVYERGQLARTILLNQPHSENPVLSWHGESIGHYEGDTLVVDTIGLDDRAVIDVFNVPHTTQLHVVERYRIVDDVLHVLLTVDDPGTFTAPWSASKTFDAGNTTMEEVICQEGADNFTEDQVPIPVATRFDF